MLSLQEATEPCEPEKKGKTMLTTKQITGLLYSMGHTFDNLASTYIATEEFLTTNAPQVIGSPSCKTSKPPPDACSTMTTPTG